ncbi:MAG: hypothetical protein ACRCZP_16780 [Phycicoccus sp.]
MTFWVTPDEGDPYEVVAGSRDVLIWERLGRGRKLAELGDNPTMSGLYSLAHVAARRQQLHAGSLAEFEATCDIDVQQQESPDPA